MADASRVVDASPLIVLARIGRLDLLGAAGVRRYLVLVGVSGCGAEPILDELACLEVARAETCPADDDAADELLGSADCVALELRRVTVAVGELVTREDGYFALSPGGWVAGDPDPEHGERELLARCCYAAALEADGTVCPIP